MDSPDPEDPAATASAAAPDPHGAPAAVPRRRRSLRRPEIVLLAASVVLCAVAVPVHAVLYAVPVPLALALGAALCGAAPLALIRPRLAIAAFGVAALALPLLVPADLATSWPWPWSVPAMIAAVALVAVLGLEHGWRTALVPVLIGAAGTMAAPWLRPGAAAPGVARVDLIVTGSLVLAAYLVAVLLAGRNRLGRELSSQRELTAAEQERRVLVEERARIARELHDVVAHGMSLIQVQASTARYRIPDLPDAAAAEFDDIAASARGSLTEMRRLLGVLRTEQQGPELAPQQGIADIPQLVEGLRRAGAEVELETAPPPEALPALDLPPSVQISAYRIVQEALSNAVRHAPGALIRVEVAAGGPALRLHVRNGPAEASAPGPRPGRQDPRRQDPRRQDPGRQVPSARGPHPEQPERPGHPAPPSPGPGHGLRGMRERAALLGGTLEAGPEPVGGWRVEAVLPGTGTVQEGP
ncbi:sensor histidine kinase [Brachybacterium phenoliresistens]|uniref:sensor histidine kinase n=1 Tax=Brachybacterium phenoliresistens TaxID=396014 RepID=UPI0031DD6751